MKDLCRYPLKIDRTRVWRTYFGGRELEAWQGLNAPKDGSYPEEWLASTVRAYNPGIGSDDCEGLSRVLLPSGECPLLKDLIEMDPVGFLGEKHVSAYGSQMGVLAKIIDSQNRLTIQVHPDRDTAKKLFDSAYGKTEAWYVLGGRSVDGEEPYILLGFKPGVTRALWERYFYEQDVEAMLNSLHKVNVKPGDVYFIGGGLPHAIGSGCFLIEVQEPTDYTLRVERKTPKGIEIDDPLIHQGLGFKKLFECFHYEGARLDETLKKWRVEPRTKDKNEAFTASDLIGSSETDLFGMKRVRVHSNWRMPKESVFKIQVVVAGRGSVNGANGFQLAIKQGDVLFIPAGADDLICETDDSEVMEIVVFYPPVS